MSEGFSIEELEEENKKWRATRPKGNEGFRMPARKYEKGGENKFEDFLEGGVASVMRMGAGLGDLIPGVEISQRQRDVIKDWEADAGQSWGGKVGNVGAELAMMAVPGGAALKAARGVNKINSLRKASRFTRGSVKAGAEAGGAGLYGAARLPGEGETRGGNALAEIAGSLGGSAVGGALKGVPLSEAGEALLKRGAKLTPGQATDSSMIEGIENFMERVPGVAKMTQKLREVGKKDWLKLTMKDAAPGGTEHLIKDSGVESFRVLDDAISNGYNRAWDDMPPIDINLQGRLKINIRDFMRNSSYKDSDVFKKVLDDVNKLGTNPSNDSFKRLDKVIRQNIEKAVNEGDVPMISELGKLKKMMRERLPSGEDLRRLDKKYPSYLSVRKARANAPGAEAGKYSPLGLRNAAKTVHKEKKFTREEYGLADIVRQGSETVGKDGIEVNKTWWDRAAPAFPNVPGMTPMRKLVLGDTPLQRYTPSETFEELLNPSRIGALTMGEGG